MQTAPAVLCLAFLALGGHALAAPPPAAQKAFLQGEFQTASRLAAAAADVDGLAFAARADLACAELCAAADQGSHLQQAVRHAEAALNLSPDSANAKIALAVAIGMKAKRLPLAEAFASGFAKRGKGLIDSVLDADPDNALALAVSGAWNLEVVRRGGLIGEQIYGASVKRGAANFERAMVLAPDDPCIAFQYAAALHALGDDRDIKRVKDVLRRAIATPARDSLEAEMRNRAAALLTNLGGESFAASGVPPQPSFAPR